MTVDAISPEQQRALEMLNAYVYGTKATEELIRQFETATTNRKKQKIVTKLNRWAKILYELKQDMEKMGQSEVIKGKVEDNAEVSENDNSAG
jgi:hypothetical protein